MTTGEAIIVKSFEVWSLLYLTLFFFVFLFFALMPAPEEGEQLRGGGGVGGGETRCNESGGIEVKRK